jgi:hypothetical protein
MTDAQRNLFRMPAIVEHKLTLQQRRVLDWVALNEGGAGAYPGWLSRQSLRRLISKKLILVLGQSPARYALSSVGRMVRGRPGGPGSRRVISPR